MIAVYGVNKLRFVGSYKPNNLQLGGTFDAKDFSVRAITTDAL
jgi:hypothetical protein